MNNELFIKTCLKSHFESFLCQLSSLDSTKNKRVEVFEIKKYNFKIILSQTDCKSKLDQQCTKKCLCIFNLNKKYVA